MSNIVYCAKGVVLAEFAFSDVDRLKSFFHIAKKSGKCLAVSLKQAQLLSALRKDAHLNVTDLNDEDILLFRKSKKRFDRWELDLIERYEGENTVFDVFEASKQQCNMVLALSFYDFDELVALQPAAGSCYVLSASERLARKWR